MYAYGPSHLFKATILYEDIQQCRLTETPLFCTKTDSHAWEAWKWSEVAQSCPTPCGPVDCSPPGSSLHGILQARILEWVAISFSRGSSQPRDRTQVSCIASRCFNLWATRGALTLLHETLMHETLMHEKHGSKGHHLITSCCLKEATWPSLSLWA